jgi:corrinoid protein of di/trimethylamine methyltransferase
MSSLTDLCSELRDALVDLDEEKVLAKTKTAFDEGLNPLQVIDFGLGEGMKQIGEKYAAGDFTLPHMVIGADIMQRAVGLLEPALQRDHQKREFRAKVVIGTAEGDIHDIGKKIVATLLRANGYEVIDLGRDVPNTEFVERVKAENPDFLGMSALMTTTVTNQQKVIELLQSQGLRERVRVIVGGAAVMPETARHIGADGYGESAAEGVAVMNRILISKSCTTSEKEKVPVEAGKDCALSGSGR